MNTSAPLDPFRIDLEDEDWRGIGQWLCNEVQIAYNARSRYMADGGLLDTWHGMYEQAERPRSNPWPDAADLASFIPTQYVDALRSRLVQVVCGTDPICVVDGWGESQERASRVEAFHQWKADDERLPSFIAGAIHNSLIEGNGFLEVSENPTMRRLQEARNVLAKVDAFGSVMLNDDHEAEPMLDEAGQHVEWNGDESKPYMKIVQESVHPAVEGPMYRVLSGKDFMFLPNHARNMTEVWGFAKRVYLRLPDLMQRQAQGYYRNVESLGTMGDRMQRMEDTRHGIFVQPQEGQTAEKELWEVHLFMDWNGDGVQEWVMATVSLRYWEMIRFANDDIHQMRVVNFVPFPRTDSPYGYSLVGDKLVTTTEEHTALRNMLADGSALAVNKPIKRLANAHWDPNTQPWGPGAVIDVRTMDEIQQQQVYDVPQSIPAQIAAALNAAERIAGQSDQAVIGVTGDGPRPTATQVQTVAHASFVRVEESVRYIQYAIEDLYMLRQRIWIKALESNEQGLTAPDSVLQGLLSRGIDIPTDGPFRFTAADLAGNWRFRPRGSVETADVYRMRDDLNQFIAQALPRLFQLFPALAQQFANNPKIGEALMQHMLRVYRMTDLSTALQQQGPPMPAQMGLPPGPPAGAPQGVPPQMAALMAAQPSQVQ